MATFARSTQGNASAVQSITCISCRMTFPTPKDQREHYKTDFHRFNLKRKVAELPPVTLEVFKEKVENTAGGADSPQIPQTTPKQNELEYGCRLCRKTFNSDNTLQNHLNSKKHKDAEKQHASKLANSETQPMDETDSQTSPNATEDTAMSKSEASEPVQDSTTDSEKTVEQIIEERMKNAKRFTLEECMFCNLASPDLDSNVKHMASKHGFFIPDAEYLVDLDGLIKYLGELIAVGNACLWCGDKRAFFSTRAVQDHMCTMNHCKINYEDEAEFEDFYDFSKDYEKDENNQLILKDMPAVELSDNGTELVVDGKTIGHRSLAIYYKQRYRPQDRRQSRVAIDKMLSEYKLLGWKGTSAAVSKASIPRNVQKRQQQIQMRVGIANNNQKHFRDSTIML